MSLVDLSKSADINLTVLKAEKIMGTVSLPEGEVAPRGGYNLRVGAISENGSPDDYKDDYSNSESITIPEGKSSKDYCITVLPCNGGYSVYYDSQYSNSKDYEYVTKGYYSKDGTVADSSKGTLVDVSKNTGINLSILKGNSIRGTVSLPEGEVAPKGGLSVRVLARSDNGIPNSYSLDFSKEVLCKLPEGKSSASYSITVSPSNSGYSVYYIIDDKKSEYMKMGFYSMDGTVPNESSKSLIDIAKSPVVNLTILKGNAIKGTVSLPAGDIAPKGGIVFKVGAIPRDGAFDKGNDYYVYAQIPEGKNSVEYNLVVSPSVSLYCVYYSHGYINETGYLRRGYYSINGTTAFDSNYNVDAAKKDRVDITVLKK